MGSLAKAIEPKSDQLNADDLITGPLTVTVTEVQINEQAEQKVVIRFDGDNGKPYKPCKSMTRVMAEIWGGADNGKSFVGQSMTLYRDPRVKWGGVEIGGIRISHMTGIERDTPVILTVTKGKRTPMIIHPLRRDNLQPVTSASVDKAADGVKYLINRVAECDSHALEALLADEGTIKQRAYLQRVRPALSVMLEDAIRAATVPHGAGDVAPFDAPSDWTTIAMDLMAEIDAAQTKAEIQAISKRQDYADAKANCTPEVWAAVQAAARQRLEAVK